jgi:hypothetical protein
LGAIADDHQNGHRTNAGGAGAGGNGWAVSVAKMLQHQKILFKVLGI